MKIHLSFKNSRSNEIFIIITEEIPNYELNNIYYIINNVIFSTRKNIYATILKKDCNSAKYLLNEHFILS